MKYKEICLILLEWCIFESRACFIQLTLCCLSIFFYERYANNLNKVLKLEVLDLNHDKVKNWVANSSFKVFDLNHDKVKDWVTNSSSKVFDLNHDKVKDWVTNSFLK